MSISFVRSNFNSGATGATITCAFTSNSAGNLLVVAFETAQSADNTSISDTAGNIWQTAGFVDNVGGNWRKLIYYAENCNASASTNTVTVTFAATGPTHRIAIAEYSGIATSLSYSNNRADISSGTSLSTGNFTVTSGDLVVTLGFTLGGSIAAGAGFTSRQTDGFFMLEDMIASSSTVAGLNSSASGSYSILAVAFHPSPAPSQSPYAGGDMYGSTASTAVKAVFPSNTAGHILIAAVQTATNANPTSVTDTAGNTWTLITSVASGTSFQIALYYVASCVSSSGQNTVTATYASSAAIKRIWIAEYPGTGPLVASASSQASTTSLSSGSLASASGNLIVACGFGVVRNVSAGSGYVSRKTEGFMLIEDKTSSSNSENPNIVLPSSGAAAIIAASFGAVGGTQQPIMFVVT